MAQRPKFRDYFATVIRCSLADFDGAGRYLTIISYIAIALFTILSVGAVEDLLKQKAQELDRLLSWTAVTWLALLFLVITPYRIWADEKHKNLKLEDANKPRIQITYRFNNPYVELVVTNISAKTISGIDVMFRNYKVADQPNTVDILKSLVSNDGKRRPIHLDPRVPTYFRIARLAHTSTGAGAITILPETDSGQLLGSEVGVKLGVSGNNIAYCPVSLRLTVQKNNGIAIEPWERDKNTVGVSEGEE